MVIQGSLKGTVNMKSRLDKSARSLMACDLTNSVVSLFGETFLVAYFLQISNENIIKVSIFYIILYSLLGLGNILLGYIIKSKPQKRVVIYRFGIIVKSIYILLIALFKEKISKYFIIFAIFYGIAETLYWSTHDIMNIEIVENENRKKYMTTKRMLGKLINIVVPIILGTSIELTSFINMSIYIFALTLIQIIISLHIDINKFGTEDKKERYSLSEYHKNLSIEQKEKINKIYKLAFLYGIMMDTIRVLVVIITIMTFKTSLNLGILTTVFSIFSMISLYLFNKLYQIKYSKKLLASCATLVVLGVMCLIVDMNRTTLIVYNFTYNITIYFLEVMFKIKADNIVKEYNIEKWIVEYHTFVEGFMEIGRITGFILMLVAGLLNKIFYFKLLLLIVTVCIPIYAIIMYSVENQINNK